MGQYQRLTGNGKKLADIATDVFLVLALVSFVVWIFAR